MSKKKDQKQTAPYRLPPTTRKHWLNEGNTHCRAGRYEEALSAYDHALQLDPDYSQVYCDRGDALLELKRYEEALASYERAIQLNTNNSDYHSAMGSVLLELKRYDEALKVLTSRPRALMPKVLTPIRTEILLLTIPSIQWLMPPFEQSIHLNPNNSLTHDGKRSSTLYTLRHYKHTLAAHEQAIRLEPQVATYYINQSATPYREWHGLRPPAKPWSVPVPSARGCTGLLKGF